MEREKIPIISMQVTIMVMIVLSILYLFGRLPILKNDNQFYLAVGALAVLLSPLLSQIVYSIWKKHFGFKSYDFTRYLINCDMSDNIKENVQSLFDRFWHNDDNINKNIIDYSRTRSFVCQMFLFSSRILGLTGIIYIMLTFYFHNQNNIYKLFFTILFFFITIILIYYFDMNYQISSKELRRCELDYLKRCSKTPNKGLEDKCEHKYNNFKLFRDEYKKLTGLDLNDQIKKAENDL